MKFNLHNCGYIAHNNEQFLNISRGGGGREEINERNRCLFECNYVQKQTKIRTTCSKLLSLVQDMDIN